MGQERARILSAFDANRGRVGLAEEGVERHRRLVMHLVVAEAQSLISHKWPP